MGAQLGGSHFDNRTTLLLKRVPLAPAGFISWPAAVEDLQLSAFGPPQKPGLHHREHMSQKLWRAIDRRSTRRIRELPGGWVHCGPVRPLRTLTRKQKRSLARSLDWSCDFHSRTFELMYTEEARTHAAWDHLYALGQAGILDGAITIERSGRQGLITREAWADGLNQHEFCQSMRLRPGDEPFSPPSVPFLPLRIVAARCDHVRNRGMEGLADFRDIDVASSAARQRRRPGESKTAWLMRLGYTTKLSGPQAQLLAKSLLPAAPKERIAREARTLIGLVRQKQPPTTKSGSQ